MLKKIQDRLQVEIDDIRSKEFLSQHPAVKHEPKYGPVHAIEEAKMLETKLALARKKLQDFEEGRPSQKEVKEEAKLQHELDAEREKLAGEYPSKKGQQDNQSKQEARGPASPKEAHGRVKNDKQSHAQLATSAAQGPGQTPSSSMVAPENQNMAKLYYKAGNQFWKANPTSLFSDWTSMQNRWDKSFKRGSVAPKGKATAQSKAQQLDYAELTGTAYTQAFMSKFAAQLKQIEGSKPEDIVARALYLAAENDFLQENRHAKESDWKHEKIKLDSASPAAILSWRVGDETALYSQEAADLYKQAQEEEAKAREMYYKAQETYWQAEHQASYEDWQRAQQQWNYWYSNPYATAPTDPADAPAQPKLAQLAYRERFFAMYKNEMKHAHADSPIKYVAQTMYLVAQHSFFAAKPGAGLSDWEEAKKTWDTFYREDKKLDAQQRSIDVLRATVAAHALSRSQNKALHPQVCVPRVCLGPCCAVTVTCACLGPLPSLYNHARMGVCAKHATVGFFVAYVSM